MPEFTSTEDPMQTVFAVAFQAGTRVVREVASLYGWDAVRSAGPGAELDEILSATEQTILYGAIRDILAGRVPSPFASPGPVA